MILLDTNVPIYAFDSESRLRRWAESTIATAVSDGGAAISAVSLAEICVGDHEPSSVADRVRLWGVEILEVPAAAADVCAAAYRRYRKRRAAQSGASISAMPLPDFFIGAHAEIMSWEVATADGGRFRTYFPSVVLRTPPGESGAPAG
jgi:predicted nucleic acid-binding protein